MAQIVYPGNAVPADVASGKTYSAGAYYNATGTSTKTIGNGDQLGMNRVKFVPNAITAPNSLMSSGVYIDPQSYNSSSTYLLYGSSIQAPDVGLRRVVRNTGALVWELPSQIGIILIDLDASGNIYAGMTDGVRKFERSGTLIWTYNFSSPCEFVKGYSDGGCICCFADGTVARLNASGYLMWESPSSGYGAVKGLEVDTAGTIYVGHASAGPNPSTLRRIRPNDGADLSFGSELRSVAGMCLYKYLDAPIWHGLFVAFTSADATYQNHFRILSLAGTDNGTSSLVKLGATPANVWFDPAYRRILVTFSSGNADSAGSFGGFNLVAFYADWYFAQSIRAKDYVWGQNSAFIWGAHKRAVSTHAGEVITGDHLKDYLMVGNSPITYEHFGNQGYVRIVQR